MPLFERCIQVIRCPALEYTPGRDFSYIVRSLTRPLYPVAGYGIVYFAAGMLFSPQSAKAEPGDQIAKKAFSYEEGRVPTGAAFDNTEKKLYFIDDAHDQIFKVDPANNYEAAPGTAVVNLESGDEYFGLGVANIGGIPYLAATNITDCELEIYNGATGAFVNSKTMPGTPGGPLGPKGVTFDGENWLVSVEAPPYSRINKYDLSSLILVSESGSLTIAGIGSGDCEIAFDSVDKLVYLISDSDKNFCTFDENLENVNYFEFNPGTSYDFRGAAIDEDNLEFLVTNSNSYWAFIQRYEGYDAPPTPSPSPTPAPTPAVMVLDSGDYDGDGTSDIAVFRSSPGLWAVRGVTRVYFGSYSDTPASGDYDGDGTTDIAIFRPGSGLWAVRGLTRAYFGGASDVAVPGDYDHDGSCEAGIFRKASGLWAVRGVTRVYFGGPSDRPVPAYYRGKAGKDVAVFRPSSGLWAVRGVSRIYFGSYADWPNPGDYDGDGTDDIGLFRPGSGLWAVRGVTRAYFGGSSDQPVPADYDGSGEAGMAVFRESSGLWAVRGLSRAYFGGYGDLPVAGPPCRPLTPTPTASPSPTPYTGTPTPIPTSTPITPTPTPSVTPTPVGYKTPSPTPSVMPTVEPLVESSNSDCLGPTRLDDEPEYLEVFWETNHVAVRHYNAEYNCCLERVDVEMQVEGSQIRLYETEYVPIYCYCLCPYNVFSDISPLVPGEYTVSVYKMGAFWESATVTVP